MEYKYCKYQSGKMVKGATPARKAKVHSKYTFVRKAGIGLINVESGFVVMPDHTYNGIIDDNMIDLCIQVVGLVDDDDWCNVTTYREAFEAQFKARFGIPLYVDITGTLDIIKFADVLRVPSTVSVADHIRFTWGDDAVKLVETMLHVPALTVNWYEAIVKAKL